MNEKVWQYSFFQPVLRVNDVREPPAAPRVSRSSLRAIAAWAACSEIVRRSTPRFA